jgi:hypothetical protein
MSKSTYKPGQVHANPELAEYDPQASLRRLDAPVIDMLSQMERDMLVRQIVRNIAESAELRRMRRRILGSILAILTAVFLAGVFVAAYWLL